MALCSGVAAVTLTLGVLGSVPALIRRLAAVRVPIPVRPLAVLLTMASLTAVLARPRPAVATVPPPIVRLTDETSPPTEDAETSADENVAATSTARYTVEPGDSLWRIAALVLRSPGTGEPTSADIAQFWPVIYDANRTLIGDNPNLIFPGQQLVIPEG